MAKHSSSIDDIAERYGISYTTVWRIIKRGELKAVKIGRATRILPQDEDAWVSSLKPMGRTAA